MAGTHGNWRDDAAVEYAERRLALVKKLKSSERTLEQAKARVEAIQTEMSDLDRGARAFGLSIQAPGEGEPDNAVITVYPQTDGGGALVKDIALELLERAYPSPLQVGTIKETAEARIGRALHYKTPGMTLYRLSEEGKVRRIGRDWYFVPPEGQKPGGLPFIDIEAGEAEEAIE